jgi:hypothetical protein
MNKHLKIIWTLGLAGVLAVLLTAVADEFVSNQIRLDGDSHRVLWVGQNTNIIGNAGNPQIIIGDGTAGPMLPGFLWLLTGGSDTPTISLSSDLGIVSAWSLNLGGSLTEPGTLLMYDQSTNLTISLTASNSTLSLSNLIVSSGATFNGITNLNALRLTDQLLAEYGVFSYVYDNAVLSNFAAIGGGIMALGLSESGPGIGSMSGSASSGSLAGLYILLSSNINMSASQGSLLSLYVEDKTNIQVIATDGAAVFGQPPSNTTNSIAGGMKVFGNVNASSLTTTGLLSAANATVSGSITGNLTGNVDGRFKSQRGIIPYGLWQSIGYGTSNKWKRTLDVDEATMPFQGTSGLAATNEAPILHFSVPNWVTNLTTIMTFGMDPATHPTPETWTNTIQAIYYLQNGSGIGGQVFHTASNSIVDCTTNGVRVTNQIRFLTPEQTNILWKECRLNMGTTTNAENGERYLFSPIEVIYDY